MLGPLDLWLWTSPAAVAVQRPRATDLSRPLVTATDRSAPQITATDRTPED